MIAQWKGLFKAKQSNTGGKYQVIRSVDGSNDIEEQSDNRADEEKTELQGHLHSQYAPNLLEYQYTPLLLKISTCLLACSIALLAFMYHYAPSDAACERKHWAFSPMMEVMEFEWRQHDSDKRPEEYYGTPTDERRAVWELIYDQGNIAFPYDKMAIINKSVEDNDWWRLPPPNDDQVIAFPEMVHQMHCVALLWLFAYREHWDYRTVINMSELVFELHTNHCYLTLFTIVKCQADVTPVLFQKDNSELGAWKTRDAPHRCKNFDLLSKWETEHKVCRSNCMYGDFLEEPSEG